MINLEEILTESLKINRWYLSEGLKTDVLNAMRVACNTVIDECSNFAEADYNVINGISKEDSDEDIEVYILKHSILQVKEMIK